MHPSQSSRDLYVVESAGDTPLVSVNLIAGQRYEIDADSVLYNQYGTALCRLVPITQQGTRLQTLAADVPKEPT